MPRRVVLDCLYILWIDVSSFVDDTYKDRRSCDGVVPIVPAFPAADREALHVGCDETRSPGVLW